jgi:hypothetical protein
MDMPPMSHRFFSVMTGSGWYLAAKIQKSKYGMCSELIFHLCHDIDIEIETQVY